MTESPRPHRVDVLGALLFAHIAVRNAETGRACIFRMLAPTWEREILRVAHSIWFILAQHLSVARRSESKHLTAVIQGLLKLLVWSFAESGSKAPDFDSSTNALGVTINVAKLHLGEVEIDNTPSRKEDLAKIVNDILQSNLLPSIDAFKFRGRMQFTAGQLFGLAARLRLNQVTHHAYRSTRSILDPETALALIRYKNLD